MSPGCAARSFSTSPLERLPTEILLCIVEYVLPCSGDPNPSWYIALDVYPAFLDSARARTSRSLRHKIFTHFFGTLGVVYVSSALGSHRKRGSRHHTAAHDLQSGFDLVGKRGISSIRKLRLEMYASELLMLFAPPEVARLLCMPDERRHVWLDVRAFLQRTALNRLHVVVLNHTCPRLCKAGLATWAVVEPGSSFETSSSRPLAHLCPDHRWIIKSVLATLQPRPPQMTYFTVRDQTIHHLDTEVQHIAAQSWNALHSATAGYHRCDILACADLRWPRWASRCDRSAARRYCVPLAVWGGGREGGEGGVGMMVEDVFADAAGWFG